MFPTSAFFAVAFLAAVAPAGVLRVTGSAGAAAALTAFAVVAFAVVVFAGAALAAFAGAALAAFAGAALAAFAEAVLAAFAAGAVVAGRFDGTLPLTPFGGAVFAVAVTFSGAALGGVFGAAFVAAFVVGAAAFGVAAVVFVLAAVAFFAGGDTVLRVAGVTRPAGADASAAAAPPRPAAAFCAMIPPITKRARGV